MKNVLITGSTGFLGSHLLHNLLQNNYRVILLKRSTSSTWRINDIIGGIKTYNIDTDGIEPAFVEQHIDIVIHTTCCYGRNGEKPSIVADTNIMLGLKLFEFSDKFNTDTLLQKYLNNYTLSKKHFVEWLKQLAGKVQVINMKLEHMYGPKDNTTKFLPGFIEQIRQNKEKIDLIEGKQERDFVYVADVVSAYLKTLEQSTLLPEFSEFDVGTGNLVTLRQFVTELTEQYKTLYPENKTELVFGSVPYRENELMKVKVDVAGLRSLGWEPEYSTGEGIKSIIAPPPTRIIYDNSLCSEVE